VVATVVAAAAVDVATVTKKPGLTDRFCRMP